LRFSLRYLVIVLVLVAAAIILPACSKGGEPANSAQTSTQAASAPSTNPAGSTAGAIQPGGMPDIADMKSLASYRLAIMNKMVEGEGAGASPVSYIKYEWIRDQKAEHAWLEDGSGKVTEMYITIGDKNWIWMGIADMGWIEQPPKSSSPGAVPSDLASQLKQIQKDVKNSRARFDKKGTETVNNVRCTRYEIEYNITIDMPNLAGGGTNKNEVHASGDVWIADQTGLPAVMVKSKSRSEITAAGKKTVMESEQSLSDINTAITINPPQGAKQVPGSPTPPSISTTLPVITPSKTITQTPSLPPPPPPSSSAAVTPGGEAPVLAEYFDGKWDPKLGWTDPKLDAHYDLASHPGFLRITSPDGNDLAGGTNFDAPRLVISRNGNFSIETLVEFDPTETYQGAGLLVWQDENTFLRLEFGYGGMGGESKNVAFLIQEEGALGLVNCVELPDATKRIELRIKRNGFQFTASWRQVGGAWQDAGSTKLNLNSRVDVGIVQITQYTSSEIPADFDYFRLYAK
jgi:regulation of enolase protein 1 (concanavalin A-like superfamily)